VGAGGVVYAIADRTRADVADRRGRVPVRELHAAIADAPAVRDFSAALQGPGLGLIAEYKPKGPRSAPFRPGAGPEDMALHYAPYAAAISVLTDAPFFGGSHVALRRMRAAVPVPVLDKDFVVTEYQVLEARAAGADAVLLMACLLDAAMLLELLQVVRGLGMEALVEVLDRRELDRVLAGPSTVIGVNARDLRTLDLDLGRAAELLDEIPADRVAVSASGVRTRTDADQVRGGRADAALIGTSLMRAPDPTAHIESLGFVRCR
jgi:indole-3-glycerol phosphate synthase